MSDKLTGCCIQEIGGATPQVTGATVQQLSDIRPTGIIAGAKISKNVDTTKIDISAGSYYIQGVKYQYAGATAVDPGFDTGENTVFIYLDGGGLQLRNTSGDLAEWTSDDLKTQGTLGRLTAAGTGPGAVVNRIRNDRWLIDETEWRERIFQREAIGNIYASGGTLTENATVFRLDQASGVLFDVERFRHVLGNVVSIGGLKVIASGPTITPAIPITIPLTYDDGAGGETVLLTNNWASHSVLKSPKGPDDDGTEGTFIMVVSSTDYASQLLAQSAIIETGPFDLTQFAPVARILVRGGSILIEEIIDERPLIGNRGCR